MLDSIQQNLFERAKKFRDEHTRVIDSKQEFYDFFTPRDADKPEIHGGFALAHWNGSREVEEQIKNDLKVTIRVIPLDDSSEPGKCIFTGEPSSRRVIWAQVPTEARSAVRLTQLESDSLLPRLDGIKALQSRMVLVVH